MLGRDKCGYKLWNQLNWSPKVGHEGQGLGPGEHTYTYLQNYMYDRGGGGGFHASRLPTIFLRNLDFGGRVRGLDEN